MKIRHPVFGTGRNHLASLTLPVRPGGGYSKTSWRREISCGRGQQGGPTGDDAWYPPLSSSAHCPSSGYLHQQRWVSVGIFHQNLPVSSSSRATGMDFLTATWPWPGQHWPSHHYSQNLPPHGHEASSTLPKNLVYPPVIPKTIHLMSSIACKENNQTAASEQVTCGMNILAGVRVFFNPSAIARG